ncbi:MAG: hypothetical protein NT074_02685 [Methanomicrobiales archaeon]|nr:hypothetical protein [Methanomicrobiales archaeon]
MVQTVRPPGASVSRETGQTTGPGLLVLRDLGVFDDGGEIFPSPGDIQVLNSGARDREEFSVENTSGSKETGLLLTGC